MHINMGIGHRAEELSNQLGLMGELAYRNHRALFIGIKRGHGFLRHQVLHAVKAVGLPTQKLGGAQGAFGKDTLGQGRMLDFDHFICAIKAHAVLAYHCTAANSVDADLAAGPPAAFLIAAQTVGLRLGIGGICLLYTSRCV